MEKKKKVNIVKKYSLNFPFRYEYRIITGETISEYLLKRMKLLKEFNSKTRSSVKFGVNSCVSLIQNEKDTKLILAFIFYDENIKSLIDMIILKCKDKTNVKLYLIDKGLKNYFCSIFKIKKLLAFSVKENEANIQLLCEIVNSLLSFESNNLDLIYDCESIMKELSHQK